MSKQRFHNSTTVGIIIFCANTTQARKHKASIHTNNAKFHSTERFIRCSLSHTKINTPATIFTEYLYAFFSTSGRINNPREDTHTSSSTSAVSHDSRHDSTMANTLNSTLEILYSIHACVCMCVYMSSEAHSTSTAPSDDAMRSVIKD